MYNGNGVVFVSEFKVFFGLIFYFVLLEEVFSIWFLVILIGNVFIRWCGIRF